MTARRLATRRHTMKRPFLITALTLFVGAAGARAAAAETYVYVHGWLPSGDDLSHSNNGYWSPYPWGNTLSGAVHVGWHTGQAWPNGVDKARVVLDDHCTRAFGGSCTVVCHSTGCAVTG